MKKQIAIVGGGAAGVFCALQLGASDLYDVHLFEKSEELLKKVKISGGGRCNVTHRYVSQSQFAKNYPRGQSVLKKNFDIFSGKNMIEWLESRGVKLKTEEDGRVFPLTDQSQTVIDCFLTELKKAKTIVHFSSELTHITQENHEFLLEFTNKKLKFDYVVIATGGAQKYRDLDIYRRVNIPTISTVPSLFTFKIHDPSLTKLMGLSVSDVSIRIKESKLAEKGPVLITHWGLSGPAILKLSAWGAFLLAEKKYSFDIAVNWMGGLSEVDVLQEISGLMERHRNGRVDNYRIQKFPHRFWSYLLNNCHISEEKRWGDLSKKDIHRLAHTLIHSEYSIQGKTTYKDEFVTAGGIDIEGLNTKTMESKSIQHLYFIGEVTNIDGITGGFNFQNAWTSAYVCAKSILQKIDIKKAS